MRACPRRKRRQEPRRQRTWEAQDGGAAPGGGWRRQPSTQDQSKGASRVPAPCGRKRVSDLTRSRAIKLNQRVSLRHRRDAIAFRYRTIAPCPDPPWRSRQSSYSGRRLRFNEIAKPHADASGYTPAPARLRAPGRRPHDDQSRCVDARRRPRRGPGLPPSETSPITARACG
jgi:hypothetical protein